MTTAATVLAASLAPTHPALRWTPLWQPNVRGQHRRKDAETTACGIVGALTLAETTDAYCCNCFPRRASPGA